MFWLNKFGELSKENQKDWIKILQSVKNSEYEKIIVSYLKWNLKKEAKVVDLPSYWFNRFRRLSKEKQEDWLKVIESEKNSEKDQAWLVNACRQSFILMLQKRLERLQFNGNLKNF